MLTYEVEKITYEEVETWVSQQDVYIEGDTIIVEDTGQDAADIWVDSFTQPGNFNGVDILWVIDPSGSMANDRVRVVAGIADMIAVLPATDWRLAIISTDPARAAATQLFPLIPGDDATVAEQQMNATVVGHQGNSGQLVDICAEDWSQGVADASNQIQQYEYWELRRLPLYDNRIYVFIDGVPNYDWYYEPTENRVYFNTMPEEKSLVEIAYYYQ
jgi:hypothetical protein